MNVIFFGSSTYVIPIITFLNKTYALTLVVTTEQSPTLPVPKYCIEHHIPYICVSAFFPDTKYKIQNTKSEIAVLASFGIIVSQEIIDLFPKGIINIHPSLLPEYRGPTPGVQAILDGKTETGVSIMLLDNKMDHGPVLKQEKITIAPDDTADSLYTKAFEQSAHMLATTLPAYIEEKLLPTPQDDSKATYTKPLTRESGKIDLNYELGIKNYESIARKVRAYYPWPGVWTTLRIKNNDLRIKILPLSSHPEPRVTPIKSGLNRGNLVSGSFPFLLQPEGKKPMSYKDFINGYAEGKGLLEKLGLV